MGDVTAGVVARFAARLEAVPVHRAGGRSALELHALRQLVAEDPELAELYVRTAIAVDGVDSKATLVAMLLAIDHAVRGPVALLEARGVALPRFELVGEGSGATPSRPTPTSGRHPRSVLQLAIPDDVLLAADAAWLVDELRRQEPRALHGSLVLDFPRFREDPRADFHIPEVRAFITALDRALPHMPAFIVAEPSFQQILIYFGSLMPLEMIPVQLGFWAVHGSLAQLADVLGPRAQAVCAHCAEHGADGRPLVESWLPSFAQDDARLRELRSLVLPP